MKVLFYSSFHATPHIETELEIAKKLMAEGHEIYFLRCKGELNTCFANPAHSTIGCKLCISKIANAYKRLGIPAKNIIAFPKIIPDISDIPFKEAKNISELKRLYYKGADIGMAVASSLVSHMRDHNPDLGKYSSYIKAGFETFVAVYETAAQILDELKPDQVYLFNGRFLEVRPFMRICHSKKIDYYTHERGGTIQRYMLRENSIPHSLEFSSKEMIHLWGNAGKEKKEIGRRFFVDRRDRVIQGWHSFTKDQIRMKLPAGFDSQKENITIFNSSMDEYEGLVGFDNPIYADDNDGIRKIVAAFENDHGKHFYLRVHPNLRGIRNSQIREIEEIARVYKNLTVIPAEQDIDSYELMEKSDKILAFSSTMGIESVFWGKPVILVSRSFYEQMNCFYRISSHEQLVALINQKDLVPFNQEEALKFGYWCLNYGVPFKYYKALSVTKGLFNGKKISPSLFWRICYILKNRLKNDKS